MNKAQYILHLMEQATYVYEDDYKDNTTFMKRHGGALSAAALGVAGGAAAYYGMKHGVHLGGGHGSGGGNVQNYVPASPKIADITSSAPRGQGLSGGRAGAYDHAQHAIKQMAKDSGETTEFPGASSKTPAPVATVPHPRAGDAGIKPSTTRAGSLVPSQEAPRLAAPPGKFPEVTKLPPQAAHGWESPARPGFNPSQQGKLYQPNFSGRLLGARTQTAADINPAETNPATGQNPAITYSEYKPSLAARTANRLRQ